MEKRHIPFSPPDISELEIESVCEVLRSGWITTGPKVKEFERNLADFCGTDRVVCLNSATAALELNLRVLGIGENDEVIVPAYTYTATASAVVHVGARVIFSDSKADSFEMDYDNLESLITDKTKAIIPVDIAGIPCDYDRIFEIVNNKKSVFKPSDDIQKAIGRVVVIADSAHGLGAEYKNKKTGNLADFTSFSFHAVKNLTTAEGGAATWKSIDGIDNEDLYKQYQLYSLHGQSKDAFSKTQLGSWEYDIIGAFYKCNMTDIMAAIGLKQLERYDSMLKRRRQIIEKYDLLSDKLNVKHLCHYNEIHKSSGHLYLIRIPGISVDQRNEIIMKMAERAIACNVHYKPLPMMTAYKNMGVSIENYPNAFDFYHNLISLPLHTKLSDEDVDYVMENLEIVLKDYLN